MEKKRPGRRGGRAAHRYWILRALSDADHGKASKREVLKSVYPKIEKQLRPRDLDFVKDSPEHVWENEFAWASEDLKRDGRLKDDSSHGTWEISDAGREWLKKHPDPPKWGLEKWEWDPDDEIG